MNAGATDKAAAWIYNGLWGVLVEWFRVPRAAPETPAGHDGTAHSFNPAPGYLRYVKLSFWIILVIIDLALLAAWLVIFSEAGAVWALALAIPWLVIMIVPDVIAYIGIHLRYDTMWYVLTDKSMRLRRGVMLVRETTITYENVQNVSVRQGPLQRYFGIANVVVETAGGGGGESGTGSSSHTGVLEGVSNASELRDLIMTRVRQSRSAGLGDDDHRHRQEERGAFGAEHLDALRAIRDEARALAERGNARS